MNRSYVDELINRNRTGILIKLIKVSIHNWSVKDFQYIFETCIKHRLYDIFHFMMDHFIRSDCISFYDNFMHCGNIFVWICKNGHTDVVKYLLSDEVTEKYPNINPYAQNNSGLRFVCDAKPACSYGHVGIVKYLLSDKVTDKYPCAKDNFGLCRAYKNGQINMVKYLLSNEVTDNYPKLHPKNLDKKLKIDIERLLGYSI